MEKKKISLSPEAKKKMYQEEISVELLKVLEEFLSPGTLFRQTVLSQMVSNVQKKFFLIRKEDTNVQVQSD